MEHQILSKKEAMHCHAFNVSSVELRMPDSRIRQYDLVDHPDSVTIIPVDSNGDIWFVEQYRVGSQSKLIELPAGVIDEGETPLACANREIREEIGMAAQSMDYIGAVYLAPGYVNEKNHIFLATNLVTAPLQRDDDEFIATKIFSARKIDTLIQNGQLIDSKSIAALHIYHLTSK